MNPRSISNIALDIKVSWKPVRDFSARNHAEPYLRKMMELDTVDEEGARPAITYFLRFAAPWKGEEARRLKDELQDILGIKPIPNGQKRKRMEVNQ